MAKFIPKIIEPILNFVPGPALEESVTYASKAMRAMIIADRYRRGFEKADTNGPKDAYDNGPIGGEEPTHRSEIVGANSFAAEGYTHEPVRLSRMTAPAKAYISIVDIDYNPAKHANKKFYSYIQLPFVPDVLSYNPESEFVGIASFGSNNPIYHYTGSEDTLSFTIDWFSKEAHRQDVIFNCRWLEALTKADGYEEAPHRVKIIWGGQNEIPVTQENYIPQWENPSSLFEDSVWVLTSAPYQLSQFVRGYRNEYGNVVSTGMLPQQALQTVTFKRITSHNRTTREIIGNIGVPR